MPAKMIAQTMNTVPETEPEVFLNSLLGHAVETLPTLPVVALELLQLAARDSASTEDLVRVIGRDQVISARLLKIANSPLFGQRDRVTSLSRAASLLGFEEVRSLALALAVFESMGRTRVRRSSYQRSQLWNHSLVVGILAEILARDEFGLGPGYYVYGLIHDIGKVVVDAYLPDQFKKILDEIEFRQRPWPLAEFELLGADHGLIGSMVLRYWGLPEPMIQAASQHHQPWSAAEHQEVAGVVYVADLFARMLGFYSFEPETRVELRYYLTMRAITFLTERGWVFEASLLDRLRKKLAGVLPGFDPASS